MEYDLDGASGGASGGGGHGGPAAQFDVDAYHTDLAALPLEQLHDAPIELIADFQKIVRAEEVDTVGDGIPDAVDLDGTRVALSTWRESQFNDLGRRIPRDDSQKVANNRALIRHFNQYDQGGSVPGKIFGAVFSVISLGLYNLGRRKTIPPGYFGHYISSQRHMLTMPGVRRITATTDKWSENVLMDDAHNPNRSYGDKTILQVPENHVAGGFRIGKTAEEDRDQEFVLFSQGRHVLPDSKYYSIDVKKLDTARIELGPLTIVYVKEGWLLGAFRRRYATYEVLYPGPPYILHEQEYEQIELVQRTDDLFTLGPYEFVTVKDGYLAGAYERQTGAFKVLPSGHSYQLHSKDFEKAELVLRKDQFKLGPFYFITVRKGMVAGAYQKQHEGKFLLLPPGKTYQLNEDDYKEPVKTPRDTHIVRCGPYTFLTVEEGKLSGAYRVADGRFAEFDRGDHEYQLHDEMYHGLVTIQKYSSELQQFGPYKVITIREGFTGLFENEGSIEIKEPGFYKVPSSYTIYDPIPMKVFQDLLTDILFKTKDGISMQVKFTLTWNVDNPKLVAKFAGTFSDMKVLIRRRAMDTMIRLCKQYNRGELLPTQQDIFSGAPEELDEKELLQRVMEATTKLYKDVEARSMSVLRDISQTSQLGVEIKSIQVDNFVLMDESIMRDLAEVTKSQLATKAEKVKGELAIAKAEADKRAREKLAEADAAVTLRQAEATASVTRLQAIAEADSKIQAAKAQAEVKVQMETAGARAKAESQRITMEIQTEKTRREAAAQAEAISLIAQAEYDKKMKDNEAASHIPKQEIEMRMAKLQVEMLSAIGQAAWQYPDVYTGFLKTFSDKLRFGPMTAGEALSKMGREVMAEEKAKGPDAIYKKK